MAHRYYTLGLLGGLWPDRFFSSRRGDGRPGLDPGRPGPVLTLVLAVGLVAEQDRLAGQLEPALIVDGNQLDGKMIADFADFIDALDVAVGQFADMAESLDAGGHFDKRPEFLDGDDAGVFDTCARPAGAWSCSR